MARGGVVKMQEGGTTSNEIFYRTPTTLGEQFKDPVTADSGDATKCFSYLAQTGCWST